MDERKLVFNTVYEFWAWAIQFPGKRKAINSTFSLFSIHVDDYKVCVCFEPVNDTPVENFGGIPPGHFPLTAFEDEFGLIDQPEVDPLVAAFRDALKTRGGDLTDDTAKDFITLLRKEISESLAKAASGTEELQRMFRVYGSGGKF